MKLFDVLGYVSVEPPRPTWDQNFCPNPFPKLCFSGHRDLVLTMAYGECIWYHNMLLSVRSSGCRARLILFTMKGQYFTPEYQRVIDLTQTEVIEEEMGKRYHDFWRNSWFREYITNHVADFDRIFVCDAMDVMFERDPFEFLTGRRMIFTEECAKFRYNPGNTRWVADAYGEDFAKSLSEYFVLNWGTIYGDPESWIAFYNVVWSNRNWRRTQIDQPILNWAVYSGALHRAGVNFTLMRQFGPILHITKCLGNVRYIHGLKVLETNVGTFPHVLHQWKKKHVYREFIKGRCIIPDERWKNRSAPRRRGIASIVAAD